MVKIQALIQDLESLTITQGQGVGAPLVLFAWERRFLKGAFSPDVSSAALSIARGNGKTALCAAIATAAIDGSLRQARAETVIVASSLSQAKIAFDHVVAFLRARHGELGRREWSIHDSPQRAVIVHKASGAVVRCIGSDPKRAHGLAPTLILADEPAQWESGKADKMIAALRTSMGKIPNARLIALGTQPDNPDNWFSRMLNTSGAADYVQVHAAPENSPPFRKTTWLKANPSLRGMPALESAIRKEAQRARRDVMELASFKALRLNQPVSDVLESLLIEASTWRGIETPEPLQISAGHVLGLDLGTSAAMSAAAAYSPLTGALDAFAVFPEIPSLAERGLRDGVGGRYGDMARRGELIVRGERVSDIGAMLREAQRRWGKPVAIVCDRWREAELRQELDRAQFPSGAALVVRGQGFKDGGEDVRDFRKAVLDGNVQAPESLLLRSALSEARVLTDAAGNSKLAKKTEGGRRNLARDDAAAAAILAISEGYRRLKSGSLRAPRRMRIGVAG